MSTSEQLFADAKRFIPGGVNSPVRAFNGVGGSPVFIKRASGAYVYDADDKQYIDYVGSWGPMILGHADPDVVAAVQNQAPLGLSFGAPTEQETTLAKLVATLVPSLEKTRLVSSGTEAAMSALRLARGFTGRDKILKFEGCYHGHVDALLVKAGSGALTLGVPTSPGISPAVAADTITASYNNIAELTQVFEKHGKELAAVIVEPVAGNMNCIPAQAAFLQALREHCSNSGTVLIFDEVMSGFRVALGGAQAMYNIKPDLSIFGKVIGGGLPVGAFGGRADIMDHIAPDGPVYQAGTLSGNPLAVSAGLATLQKISAPGFFDKLSETTTSLLQGIEQAAAATNIAVHTSQAGGMFGLFFTEADRIDNLDQVTSTCNIERFKQFFHGMLEQGIYLAPSAYEAGFVSAVHSAADIGTTAEAASRVFATL